jgi:hypothetical protein
VRDLVLERQLGDRMAAHFYEHTRDKMRCQCCGAACGWQRMFSHGVWIALEHIDARGTGRAFGTVVTTCDSAYCQSKIANVARVAAGMAWS